MKRCRNRAVDPQRPREVRGAAEGENQGAVACRLGHAADVCQCGLKRNGKLSLAFGDTHWPTPAMPKRSEEFERDPAYSALQVETGRRIAAIRNLAGMTQGEAIGSLGVSQSAWSKWEKGERMPNPFIMTRFASRFRVSLDLLYRGKPTDSHPELVRLLRASVPELVAEEPKSRSSDMDKAQALYRGAIAR